MGKWPLKEMVNVKVYVVDRKGFNLKDINHV